MTHVLELIGVHAGYGAIEVLHGVDLAVPAGSVVALLGPNGAGKTTLLNVASGQHEASSGCVHVAGRHVNGASADQLARAGVCAIPEGRGVFPNLAVDEHLRIATYLGVTRQDARERVYSAFPRLAERRDQLAGTLSGGEQQMLSLARAIATDPALLMLDEISMGLAPIVVRELYAIVASLASAGVSIVVVEQYARAALAIADYAVVLAHGRVRAVGQPADVVQSIEGAYLGEIA